MNTNILGRSSELFAQIQIQPRISATALAALNETAACERCFAISWLLNQQVALDGKKFPYRIPLPGVFSVIDSHTKSIVRHHLDANGNLPIWFPSIGHTVNGYVPAGQLHYRRYRTLDAATGIDVAAYPDDIFIVPTGHFLIDYKCASVTTTQDVLFPKYEAQLAIEAHIGENVGLVPVGAALLYFDPGLKTGDPTDRGLPLPLTPILRPVELDIGLARSLLRRARGIVDTVNAGRLPRARFGCPDCALVGRLNDILAMFNLD